MKKTKQINEILDLVDNKNFTYEEYARLITELECMQESADSIDDIEVAKWFEQQKSYWTDTLTSNSIA